MEANIRRQVSGTCELKTASILPGITLQTAHQVSGQPPPLGDVFIVKLQAISCRPEASEGLLLRN